MNSCATQHHRLSEERDACAIVAFIDKRGDSTHANIVRTIKALRQMGHRSGDINGEGDGCGIMADLPRQIWATWLAELGLNSQLAQSEYFFVGHLLLPSTFRSQADSITAYAKQLLSGSQIELLLERRGKTNDDELGPHARAEAPLFWQIGGLIHDTSRQAAQKRLFQLQLEIEKKIPEIHIASLSLDTVIYKLQGIPDLLLRVFPELRDDKMCSVITLGHGRYSTNTLPTVTLSQPFSLLGHNGEINTIERLRSIGRTLGIEPVMIASDSRDLNRIIEGLINNYDLDLVEAMEMVFPPQIQEVYDFYRWFFPCSAQGPAAVVARAGDLCLGMVDAMGLRPLWFGESDYTYFLSSEKGVVDLEHLIDDPCPLAPGEKIAITASRGRAAEVQRYGSLQSRLVQFQEERGQPKKYQPALLSATTGWSEISAGPRPRSKRAPSPQGFQPDSAALSYLSLPHLLEAFGWRHYDHLIRQQEAHSGKEVIGSLGYTGPLASFIPQSLPNISDFCKENVAVVTNQALDGDREKEHFSSMVILGRRPHIKMAQTAPPALQMNSPLLLGAHLLQDQLNVDQCRQISQHFGSCLVEDVIDFFTSRVLQPEPVRFLNATFVPAEGLLSRLNELAIESRTAIEEGAHLLILDDAASFTKGRVFIDPILLVAYLQEFLIKAGCRRKISLIVHSGAIRNRHDLMLVLGVGAEAVHPYLLWRVSAGYAHDQMDGVQVIKNTFTVLQQGIQKVMSAMGIHELCGYGRIFSAVGLKTDLADILQIANFGGSENVSFGINEVEAMAGQRYARAVTKVEVGRYRDIDSNAKVGRIIRETAIGKKGYREMAAGLDAITEQFPKGIRHLLQTKAILPINRLTMNEVDLSVGEHSLPLLIAAMSFGSQGEKSFRTYAEAAQKANIICMNGEGSEIPDMLGCYRKNRGQQIASGRFGVFMGFLNSVNILEIKIGQGAKPGEGGHLPGSKVSSMVAQARHCKVGTTMISPSNHHDIYSIEDLAQLITELKTANPMAKVSVKIPVTSGVGTISVGIAKAGADIINISGFEGGTGAAREHAKRFVGLSVEIGIGEAQRALVESGLRPGVEIWADGGVRSGNDILKLMLLGANRVGLGTVALMAIGCISCRQCHLDRCPRGISTQVQTREEAIARGDKGFVPRVVEEEAENLARLLSAIGDEIRMRTAALGVARLQDLVGRSDLLRQYRFQEHLDTAELLRRAEPPGDSGLVLKPLILRKPLNYLTRLVSDLVMDRLQAGATRVHFTEERVRSNDRAVGTYLAGALARQYQQEADKRKAILRLAASVPGNGLCAFNTASIEVIVEGGSQDGTVKGSMGGLLGVFKDQNLLGRYIDGSTGKSFAYGATGGLFMVQNIADSRACVRLSGADVIFGGRIAATVQDESGNIASRAHLKGFSFEYMTGGRVVVLSDPGPWICAGMTGGIIYQCLYPEYGFNRDSIIRRLSVSAQVTIAPVKDLAVGDINELLQRYIIELEHQFQYEEAEAVGDIMLDAANRFLVIQPSSS